MANEPGSNKEPGHENQVIVQHQDDIVDRISSFIEGVRMEEGRTQQKEGQPGTSQNRMDLARDLAAKQILEAERFKGQISHQPSQGNDQSMIPSNVHINLNSDQARNFMGIEKEANDTVIDDDAFFHISCHIDRSLAEKN